MVSVKKQEQYRRRILAKSMTLEDLEVYLQRGYITQEFYDEMEELTKTL